MRSLHVLYVSSTCPLRVRYVSVTCPLRVRYVSYTCPLRVLYVSFTCPLRVIYVSVTCHLRIRYVSVTCHTCFFLSFSCPFRAIHACHFTLHVWCIFQFLDVDECKLMDCGYGQNCTNTPGSFVCSCLKGFHPGHKPGLCTGESWEMMTSLLVTTTTCNIAQSCSQSPRYPLQGPLVAHSFRWIRVTRARERD